MGAFMDKLRGKVKELKGAATGNRRVEAEGKAEYGKGRVKEGFEDVKREVKDVIREEPTQPQSP